MVATAAAARRLNTDTGADAGTNTKPAPPAFRRGWPGYLGGTTMGDLFEISPAQRRHMQAQSEALIAANPGRYLTGPYAVPKPALVAPKPMVAVPIKMEPKLS